MFLMEEESMETLQGSVKDIFELDDILYNNSVIPNNVDEC